MILEMMIGGHFFCGSRYFLYVAKVRWVYAIATVGLTNSVVVLVYAVGFGISMLQLLWSLGDLVKTTIYWSRVLRISMFWYRRSDFSILGVTRMGSLLVIFSADGCRTCCCGFQEWCYSRIIFAAIPLSMFAVSDQWGFSWSGASTSCNGAFHLDCPTA